MKALDPDGRARCFLIALVSESQPSHAAGECLF